MGAMQSLLSDTTVVSDGPGNAFEELGLSPGLAGVLSDAPEIGLDDLSPEEDGQIRALLARREHRTLRLRKLPRHSVQAPLVRDS